MNYRPSNPDLDPKYAIPGFCLLLEAGMDGAVDPALECEAVWKRVIETGAEGRRKVYERISTKA